MFNFIKLLALLVLLPCVALAESVTLVADSWCPYNCDPQAKDQGLLVDIAKYSLEKNGLTVAYTAMPWARAIVAARAGQVAGIIGAYKSDAPDFIFTESSLYESGQAVFVKSGSPWKYSGLSSLEKIALGTIKDYSYGDELDGYIKKNAGNSALIQVTGGDGALSTNVKKLLAGRIGAIVEDEPVMQYELRAQGLSDQVTLAGTFPKVGLYIAFSPAKPRSAEYAKMISAGIAELKASGQLKQILAKYGLDD